MRESIKLFHFGFGCFIGILAGKMYEHAKINDDIEKCIELGWFRLTTPEMAKDINVIPPNEWCALVEEAFNK